MPQRAAAAISTTRPYTLSTPEKSLGPISPADAQSFPSPDLELNPSPEFSTTYR